ncbi:hypothetical protein NWF32_24280 [Pseudomonas qingdaonensis]|nr:hypothetical protein [Pseudomonas qingdaonensis]
MDFISRENLSAAITGDTVFLLGGSDADVQAFLADPVLANLPAVVHKRVYALGPSSFRIDYYRARDDRRRGAGVPLSHGAIKTFSGPAAGAAVAGRGGAGEPGGGVAQHRRGPGIRGAVGLRPAR